MNEAGLRRIQPWLGTYVFIDVDGSGADAAPAVETAFAEIGAIHEAMSFHSATSDLARLHLAAHRQPIRVSPHTWAVLALALRLADSSKGLFDPTIAPRLVRQGALPRPAGPEPDAGGDWRDIELHPDCHVSFRRPLWLDLGGIAKGYAVDNAVETLQRHGLPGGCVNAGGDLRVFGDAADGQPLAVRNPADPAARIPLGTLRNRAVATSGDFFLGRNAAVDGLSPIVDPKRGLRPARPRSVTVIAEKCALADGLTKIVSLLGSDAQPLLMQFGAVAAIIEPPETLHAGQGFWAALGHAQPPGGTHRDA